MALQELQAIQVPLALQAQLANLEPLDLMELLV
jgi:hypothetical protein